MDNAKTPASPRSLKRLVLCFCLPAPIGGFNESGRDVIAHGCDEEGVSLSQHYCSSREWAMSDILCDTHHKAYAVRYPEGYECRWTDEPPANWPEQNHKDYPTNVGYPSPAHENRQSESEAAK